MAAVSYAHKCKTIFLFVLSIGLGINISQAHTYEVHGGGDPKAIDNRVKTIVIDAGHGGKDPGALGRNSKEKEIVLALALKLGKEIKKNFPGVEVIYTRDSDKFVELHERAHIANQARADLFISIHCNSAASHQACGSETFVLGLHRNQDNLEVAKRENAVILLEKNHEENYEGFDPNSEISHIILNMYQNAFLDRSLAFASNLETNLQASKRKSRGVKQAGFLVLRNTFMPSILFEAGFLTNKEEEAYLSSEAGQNKIVASFIRALRDYKKQLEDDPQLANVKTETQKSPDKVEPEKTVIANNIKPQTREIKPAIHNTVKNETAKEEVILASTDPVPVASAKSPVNPSVQTEKDDLEFCVQLAATPNKANLKEAKWRNIPNLSIRFETGMYKYQITGIKNYNEANSIKDSMKQKGFEGAFVVAYNHGNRVNISEAIGMHK